MDATWWIKVVVDSHTTAFWGAYHYKSSAEADIEIMVNRGKTLAAGSELSFDELAFRSTLSIQSEQPEESESTHEQFSVLTSSGLV